MDRELLLSSSPVEDELVRLNWNRNDAIIYVALLELGVTTPQALSEATGVDRTRVYDSLKRLVKRGYVLKEEKEWGGRYQPNPVDHVLSNEISEIKNQLEIAKEIKEKLKTIEKKKESDDQRLVWAIQSKKNIKEKILAFVGAAETRVLCLMSPDMWLRQTWLFDALVARKKQVPGLDIQVSLQQNDENMDDVRRMLDNTIRVFHRDEPLLPLALIVVDGINFIQLSISAFEPLPAYDFGIYGENISPSQASGMEYMYYHLLQNHRELK